MSILSLKDDSIENVVFQINPEINVITTSSYIIESTSSLPQLQIASGGIEFIIGNDLRQVSQNSNVNTIGNTNDILEINSNIYNVLKTKLSSGSTDIKSEIETILSESFSQNQKDFKKIKFGVERIDSHSTSSNIFSTMSIGQNLSGQSLILRDRQLPYYKNIIETIEKKNTANNFLEQHSNFNPFSYTNTYCLNLVSNSSGILNDYAIVYPNSYNLSGAFSFQFDINIRNSILNPTPNTLIFVSSSYSISIISGSSTDFSGKCDKFRLLLQIADGTDLLPENVTTSSVNCFISDDNIIDINTWYNIVIRWGTKSINNGKGEFLLTKVRDNEESETIKFFEDRIIKNKLIPNEIVFDTINGGIFFINSSSFPQILTSSLHDEPSVLFLGCRNLNDNLKDTQTSYKNYFNTNLTGSLTTASTDIHKLKDFTEIPNIFLTSSNFINTDLTSSNYCNFEVKNIKIYEKFLNKTDFLSTSSNGLIFHVPLEFNKNTKIFKKYPLFPDDKSSFGFTFTGLNYIEPNNFVTPIAQNFGCLLNNLDSFLLERISNKQPRILNLCNDLKYDFSYLNTTISNNIFNYTLSSGSLLNTNILILPCDFNFYSVSGSQSLFISSNNIISSSVARIVGTELFAINRQIYYITNSLGEIFPTASLSIPINNHFDQSFQTSSINILENQYPEPYEQTSPEIEIIKQKILSLPYTLNDINQDKNSALNVVFVVSPLLFGNKILPGFFEIKDENYLLTGKTITLCDNGYGGLCRADSKFYSKENIVGKIYYEEGIIIINNPQLYYFGKFGFNIKFRGEKNIHVYKISYSAPSAHLNKSTNNPDVNINNFSLITGINFLDDNYNVVLKSRLAQPIMKTINQRLDFKIKLDF